MMTKNENTEYIIVEEMPNIEFSERVISIGAGTYMIYKGVKDLFKKPLYGLGQLAIGGALLYRGATGTCEVKKLIGEIGTT